MFKVYQVKPSEHNPGFFKVVKAYFIYDRREEHVYQEYEAQLDQIEREEAERQANQAENPDMEVPSPAHVRTTSQDSNPLPNPPSNSMPDNSPGLARSSMREWVLRSRNINAQDEPGDGSANRASRKNSEELNEVGGRKRVESFEIEHLSRSNSSGSIGDKLGADGKISEKLFLRSFDSLNKVDDTAGGIDAKDESAAQALSLVLPPLRPRGRSYETYRGNSPFLPPNDRTSLKPIDEREDEHHYE